MESTVKEFERAYKTLNLQQQAAVDAIEGPVMVLAGPGTGKTQILAMRVGRILQETHMDPENILCLTFTEAAAREMRERLVNLIGKAAYAVSIYTFHSFGNALMQEHPEKFSGARELLPLTDLERLQIFQESMDELKGPHALKPISNPYLFVPALLAAVRSLKQEGVSLKQYQHLIATLERFLKAAAPLIRNFAGLTPKTRTEAACAALEKKLLAAAKDYPAASEQLKVFFADHPLLSDSKIRTRLKQWLQQWFQQLQRQAGYQPVVSFVYEHYQQALLRRGRYDYEDMILRVLERLQTDAALRAEVQERWQYVLVDEYQDTNGAQNELLFVLASGQDSPNVFVVGDDHQSIFRFQGAAVENLLTFHTQYASGLSLITLQTNYRSPQSLLDAAWQVMQNTPTAGRVLPLERPALTATRPEGDAAITIAAYAEETSEDYAVGRRMQQLLAAGVAPHEIAVLYRYHADAASLVTMLRQLEIPFQLEGNENVFTDRRVQQFITLLTYIALPGRDDLLATLLYFDWWQLDPLAVMQAIHTAGRERRSLFAVLNERPLFRTFLQKLASWEQLAQNETVQNIVAQVVQESGLLHVADINSLYQLNRLLAEVRRFNRAEPQLSLAVLLGRFKMMQQNNVALEAPVPAVTDTGVRLMTAHRAKGLEFEHVFVIRLTDGHWGNSARHHRVLLPPGVVRHTPIAARNEEERRLFYVAMTRAKRQLYLSYARKDSRGRGQVASVFLSELPEQYHSLMIEAERAPELIPPLTLLAAVPARLSKDDVRGWLKSILPSYVMSVTHLNNYLQCPRLFYYRNLLRVPEFKPAHLAFGTAVHAALRDLLAAWGTKKINRGWLLKQYEQHLKRAVLLETMQRDLLVLGQAVLGEYFDHYRAEFKAGAMTEYNFHGHHVRLPAGQAGLDDRPLTGLVDKIEIVDSKRQLVKVVDYKTGNPDTKSAALKHGGDYWRQVVFYKLLADRSERFPYTVRWGEVDFVEPSKRTGKFVKKEYELTEKDVKEVEQQIRSVWSDIKALKFLEAEGCGECAYCRMVH